MEEARTVLARLERIETLDRAHAEPSVLLDELRALVDEAEAWARRERDPRALAAAHVLAERERASPAGLGLIARVEPLDYFDGEPA